MARVRIAASMPKVDASEIMHRAITAGNERLGPARKHIGSHDVHRNTVPPPTDKGAFVREMFARIAPRYDAANRVISAGMDEGWRKRAIAVLARAAQAAAFWICAAEPATSCFICCARIRRCT